MRKQFLVELQDNGNFEIHDRFFQRSNLEASNLIHIMKGGDGDGYDYTAKMEKLDKVIFALYKRDKNSRAFIKEILTEYFCIEYSDGLLDCYENSDIKFRTKKEKRDLIESIKRNKK